jgi:hypothetical protein
MKFKIKINKMNPCLCSLLLWLSFSEAELRALLRGAGDELAWSLRSSALAGRLLLLAQQREALHRLLFERFEARFLEESTRYQELSSLELFERWASTHQALRGVALGGLLWALLQRNIAPLPSLQSRLAEDVQSLALCALATHTTTTITRRNDDPRSELPTRNPLPAQLLPDQPVQLRRPSPLDRPDDHPPRP